MQDSSADHCQFDPSLEQPNEESCDDTAIVLNKNITTIILNLQKKGTQSTEIAEIMSIPIEIVNLVTDIAYLSRSYLKYCDENNDEPDYETFSNETKNRFQGLTQEVIDLISGH